MHASQVSVKHDSQAIAVEMMNDAWTARTAMLDGGHSRCIRIAAQRSKVGLRTRIVENTEKLGILGKRRNIPNNALIRGADSATTILNGCGRSARLRARKRASRGGLRAKFSKVHK